MATDRTELVRFSAYSMKDLIKRKLSEDSKFTDQIYEDSNLAVLIDIVSYMYQCLVFQLNNAASESMFADTQIYENISRLCRFIGYNPRGVKPSTMSVTISGTDIEDEKILPMTTVDTGIVDSRGTSICFSTPLWNSSNSSDGYKVSDSSSNAAGEILDSNLMLVNGRWKRYSTVYTASGADYETFVLDGLKSDTDDKKYVGGNYVEVFVMDEDGETGEWWKHDLDDIFIKPQSSVATGSQADSGTTFCPTYNGDDTVYSLYMDQTKTFCIKFGNGVVGKKLRAGQKLYIFYLDTNGPDGYISLDKTSLNGMSFKHYPAMFGMTTELYQTIFYPNASDPDGDMEAQEAVYQNISIQPNYDSTSQAKSEESVEDIRQNAPEWFKTGNRLITKKDYEYFIRNNGEQIANVELADVKCMNNWDYMATFYKWLYYLGKNPPEFLDKSPDGYRYLQSSRLIQGGYEYVDAADANNLYIWLQPLKDNDSTTTRQSVLTQMKNTLNSSTANIKTLTVELYPLMCIQSVFDISLAPEEYFYKILTDSSEYEDYSYIEVTMDDSAVYVNGSVKTQVVQALYNAFDPSICKIGKCVDYSALLDSIYAINGVTNVRTIFDPPDGSELQAYACNGISFATWSDPQMQNGDIIDVGVDLQISNASHSLEHFQFPILNNYGDSEYWSNKIKVIKKSLASVNPIKF